MMLPAPWAAPPEGAGAGEAAGRGARERRAAWPRRALLLWPRGAPPSLVAPAPEAGRQEQGREP